MANIQRLSTHLTSFEIDVLLILPACKKELLNYFKFNKQRYQKKLDIFKPKATVLFIIRLW